ncbi:MAG: fumarylacetoacetate hydrolase family protein [Mariniblastus sp.]
MKLVSVVQNGLTRVGSVDENGLLSLAAESVSDMKQLITELDSSVQFKKQLVSQLNESSDKSSVDSNQLLAPIDKVEKLICIGTNYADHAREMGGEPPEIPVVFNKFPSTIIGPDAEVRLPPISQSVDFEAELVVVIGKPGRNISREQAMEHVFGYCCGNDISARDWQKGRPGGQWLLGKTFDTFAPLGPMIVTRDEIPDPQNLGIQLRLNGQTMQDSSTDQLIFPVDHLISHISKFVTLTYGDLIFTGTPSGVGAGRTPPVFLKSGDELEVEIEGLGILKNKVVADR